MRFLALLVLVGCDGAPHWTDARTDLDRVPLSVWSGGGQEFVVGGPLGSPGEALFLRHDGAGWHEIPVGSSSTLWWVFGLTLSDVWAAGENGLVVHWDGSTLQTETISPQTLFGIWGSSDDNLWVVGGRPDISGTLLHKSGGAWQEVTGLPNTGAYFKVWGSGRDDVYVCGQAGTILHWDGAAWSVQASSVPSFVSLFTVAGRSASDVYAVGGLGNAAAVHLEGGTWQPVMDPALDEAPPLGGVAVAADGSVIMVGASGAKLRGTPGAFHNDTEEASRADFHGAAFSGGQIWAVGGNWLAPAPAARHGVIVRFGP